MQYLEYWDNIQAYPWQMLFQYWGCYVYLRVKIPDEGCHQNQIIRGTEVLPKAIERAKIEQDEGLGVAHDY